jgi:hypothetical protein
MKVVTKYAQENSVYYDDASGNQCSGFGWAAVQTHEVPIKAEHSRHVSSERVRTGAVGAPQETQ